MYPSPRAQKAEAGRQPEEQLTLCNECGLFGEAFFHGVTVVQYGEALCNRVSVVSMVRDYIMM